MTLGSNSQMGKDTFETPYSKKQLSKQQMEGFAKEIASNRSYQEFVMLIGFLRLT